MFTSAKTTNGTTVLTKQILFGWLVGYFFQIGNKEEMKDILFGKE